MARGITEEKSEKYFESDADGALSASSKYTRALAMPDSIAAGSRSVIGTFFFTEGVNDLPLFKSAFEGIFNAMEQGQHYAKMMNE